MRVKSRRPEKEGGVGTLLYRGIIESVRAVNFVASEWYGKAG